MCQKRNMLISHLSQIATGRTRSLFESDFLNHSDHMTRNLRGARVLVLGGAGTIGRATIECLLDFPVRELVIIDQDENGLTRLMRSIRGKEIQPDYPISSLCMHVHSPIFSSWLSEQKSFSHVLNFVAVKHVRSEKQAHTVLHMIATNILNLYDLKLQLRSQSQGASVFSVSTDKAANPVSFMGATKRIMEHVLFWELGEEGGATKTSRFANVAFSAGSLLESFIDRLSERLPLAAPRGIQRYFLSAEEAGHICLLTSVLGQSRKIYIPNFQPTEHLVRLEDIAAAFLERMGFQAEIFGADELSKARQKMPDLVENGRYPLILTSASTPGEKPFEQFLAKGETTDSVWFSKHLSAISYDNNQGDDLMHVVRQLQRLVSGNDKQVNLQDLKSLIAKIETSFEVDHIEGHANLDDLF